MPEVNAGAAIFISISLFNPDDPGFIDGVPNDVCSHHSCNSVPFFMVTHLTAEELFANDGVVESDAYPICRKHLTKLTTQMTEAIGDLFLEGK